MFEACLEGGRIHLQPQRPPETASRPLLSESLVSLLPSRFLTPPPLGEIGQELRSCCCLPGCSVGSTLIRGWCPRVSTVELQNWDKGQRGNESDRRQYWVAHKCEQTACMARTYGTAPHPAAVSFLLLLLLTSDHKYKQAVWERK